MSEVSTTVLVLGSLGELVKKLIETESRIAESPKDRSILLEISSLRKILEEWPVIDSDGASILHMGMKISIAKLAATEKELEDMLPKMNDLEHLQQNMFWLKQLASDMLKYRNEIRKQIVGLNKLSGGVGKASAISPDADLVIAKVR